MISVQLGEKTVLAITSPLIHECLQSEDWKKRQAGYFTMGLIAEACHDSLEKNMDEALQTATKGILDSNGQVRYAAYSALALLLDEFSPLAQKKYHADLVPRLLNMMTQEENMKLQTMVVSVMINFFSGLGQASEDEEEESSKPAKIAGTYSASIFQSLFQLIEKASSQAYEPMLLEALNLMCTLCPILEKGVAEIYGKVVPMLGQILGKMGQASMQEKKIRAKIFETMGYCIEAVSEEKEAFLESVQGVTADMASVLSSGLKEDDPQGPALKEAMIKCSSFLEEKFHPYMEGMLTILLKDAQADIDIKMTNADLASKDELGLVMKVKGIEGDQKLSMNTSALQNKIAAVKLLSKVAQSMGAAFQPYVQALFPVMKELSQYKLNETIRKNALKTITAMLAAVGHPHNAALFQEMVPIFIT